MEGLLHDMTRLQDKQSHNTQAILDLVDSLVDMIKKSQPGCRDNGSQAPNCQENGMDTSMTTSEPLTAQSMEVRQETREICAGNYHIFFGFWPV